MSGFKVNTSGGVVQKLTLAGYARPFRSSDVSSGNASIGASKIYTHRARRPAGLAGC